jgi:type IV secretory pathway VirB2 component (pilin)
MEGFWSLGPFLIPITAIVGGIMAGIVATVTRGRVRELEIRERIAMIERGMVPPPESDPAGFDRSMHSMQQFQRGNVAARLRSAGVILIAVGLGLMVLMTYAAGVPREGLGVGGFIVILGLGFFVNSLFTHRSLPAPPVSPRTNEPPFPPASGS